MEKSGYYTTKNKHDNSSAVSELASETAVYVIPSMRNF